MNKKISLGAAIAFMAIVAGITFSITMMVSLNHFNDMVLNVKEREEMYKQLADIDRSARQNYAGAIDEDLLSDSISAGYIRGLGDKYSSFVRKEDYEYLALEKSGQLAQIGITISEDQTGYFVISEVDKESPAEASGMLAGDFLISIDGVDLQKVTLVNCERMLAGEAGEKITVVFRRDGIDTEKELQRKLTAVEYVTSYSIDTTGYIKISAFMNAAVPQFRSQVDKLIQSGAESLVIDLRNNNSDSFDAAVSILDSLLPSGNLGSTLDNTGKYTSLGDSDRYEINIPIAVIINSRTGNAAEYFAAAMRDFSKANTVGVQTMGKSIMQELIKMTDGSAINITTSYVYPPSKTEINGIGIKPDYEVKLTAEEEQIMITLDAKSDPQILKAVEVVNSKVS